MKFKKGNFVKYTNHHENVHGWYKNGKHSKTIDHNDANYCQFIEDEKFEILRYSAINKYYHIYAHEDDITILVAPNILEQYFTIHISSKINDIWYNLNASEIK